MKSLSSHARLASWLALTAALVGCGQSGPPTHPTSGRIELAGADVASLAGSTLEVALANNPRVRGFGRIEPDGRFELQSLLVGEVRPGIVEGEYQARIIPNEEDSESQKRATKAIAPRFLKFETSGLGVKAPSDGEVVLPLKAK